MFNQIKQLLRRNKTMDWRRILHMRDLRRSETEKAFKKTVNEVDIPKKVPMGKLVLVTEDLYQKALVIPKQSFREDEPLGKSLGLTWSDDLETIWLNAFKANLSFVLLNEDKDVIGLIAARITESEEKADLENIKDLKLREIFELLSLGDTEYFEKYNTNEAFHFLGIGVAKQYRKHGIGTFLTRVAMDFLENLEISPYHIKCEATSNFSQKLLEQYSFDIIKEIPYDEYVKCGKVVFDNTGKHKSMKIYGKGVGTDTL